MFKKTLFLSGLFAGLMMLSGCPYKSMVPLGEPVELIRTEFLGSWVPENESHSDNPAYYTISKFDSVRFAIEHFRYNEDDGEYTIKNYIGHTTSLDGLVFLNMQESGAKEYLMHRIDLVPNGLKLFEVTDNIDEKFESTKEMEAFFRKNMKLSFFYTKDEVSLLRK